MRIYCIDKYGGVAMTQHKRLTEIRERLADPLTLDNRGMNARDHAPTDLALLLAVIDEQAKALASVVERYNRAQAKNSSASDLMAGCTTGTYAVLSRAQARVAEMLDRGSV